MNIGRTAAAVATVSLLGTLLSACGSAGTASNAGTAPSTAKDDKLAASVPARFRSGINVASGVYPPMTLLDAKGNFSGFDYDLGQAIGAKLGVKLTFKTQDFDSIIPSLQSGKHNIIINGMNDTAEREKTLDFVDYFHAGMAMLVKKGNPDHITTVLDLCGKSVAVAKATVQAGLMKEESKNCARVNKGPITVTELPTENDALLAVRAGKASADVLDAAPAEYSAKTAGDGRLFEVVHDAEHPLGYNPVYTGIGILKKDHDLAAVIQQSLQALIEDGTYKKLLDKYNLSSYMVDSAAMNHGS
jgi:polar amino acid transport system substrate-binding protein